MEPGGVEAGSAAQKTQNRTGAGELALIRRIRARASQTARPAGELRLGIGDDCAIVRPRPGEELVVTTDFSLEGRHFRRDWHSPAAIGHRALARGLSDLAAMGARPVAAFLSLGLPSALAADQAWVGAFLDGLFGLAAQAGVPLAGGDTAEAPGDALLADIVLLGAVQRGRALRRDRARAGDRLFVTGALGGAAAELASLADGRGVAQKKRKAGGQPHLFPEPRLRCGQQLLRRRLASAAIDLSDGLSTDLHHLCEASGLRAEVDVPCLPLHPLLHTMDEAAALAMALHGGEDYELLFTASGSARMPRQLGGVRLTEIGRMLAPGRGRARVALIDSAGRRKPLAPGGWEHLR